MPHRLAPLLLAAALTGCAAARPPSPAKPPAARAKVTPTPDSREAPRSEVRPAPLAGIPACLEGSPDQVAALDRLKALRRLMKEKKGAAFAEAVPRIRELLASPCYRRLAMEAPVHLDFDGPPALERWWDAGSQWLESFLSVPENRAGLPWHMQPEVLIGPDVRRILDEKAVSAKSATPERRALSWLVCPRAALRGLRASVSVLDGSPRSVDAAEEAMEDALWAAKPPAKCAAAGAKKR